MTYKLVSGLWSGFPSSPLSDEPCPVLWFPGRRSGCERRAGGFALFSIRASTLFDEVLLVDDPVWGPRVWVDIVLQ